MGCGLSTNHISRALKRESVKVLTETLEKPNSETGSSKSADTQNVEEFITSSNIGFLDSAKNSSISYRTDNFLNDNELDRGQSETKADFGGMFKRGVNPVESEQAEDGKEVENMNNGCLEETVCHGDDRLPSTDKHRQENECAVTCKLTLEDITKKREETYKQLEATMQLMATIPFRHLDQEDAPFTKEFRQGILKLAKSYFHFKVDEMPYSMISEYRRDVGRALNTNGTVRLMCDVLSDGIKRMDFIDDNRKMMNKYWFPIKNVLLTLLNFSDLDDNIRVSVTDHPDAIQLLVQVLREWQKDHLSQELMEDQNKMIRWSLIILHNCAGSDDNVQRLRSLGVIEVVLPYVDSRNENIRLSSISVIALLVNDEQAELLSAHVSIFQFVIKKLGKALKNEDRKDLGWSAAELTTAIGKLARNDANKKVLVEEGCLPLLVEQMSTGDEKETKEAVNCLWTLSFDNDNKNKMVDEPNLVKVVYKKYLALDSCWRHDCQGVLWSLREQLMTSSVYRSIGEEITNTKSSLTRIFGGAPPIPGVSSKAPGSQKMKGHVMISYQWANQEVIKQICQSLRCHGIPVWIDIDYMGGSILQAMAEAVENSMIVIMAVSQKYKDSPNTRSEAEYTFQLRKTIIPLIMQRGYRPDGWLGLIVGTKFYYDFSGKYPFQSPMDGLLKAVNGVLNFRGIDSGDGLEQVTAQPNGSSPTAGSNTHHTHTSKIDEKSVMTWTTEDIRKWLIKYNLENTTLLQLLPEEIIFLHNLKSEVCAEVTVKFNSGNESPVTGGTFRVRTEPAAE